MIVLSNSYIHLPGVGAATEKKIWDCGIRSWDEFRQNCHYTGLSKSRIESLLHGVAESQRHLNELDHTYFAGTLPPREHWRAYSYFKNDTVFLDIETTGLSASNNDITIIGIHGKGDTRLFIKGINLDEFPAALEDCKCIVTFNGARFDLPFISHHFPDIRFHQFHIDLMYVLRRLGFVGGLKNIESEMGLFRSDETAGLGGFDAVRLWHSYSRGSQEALDTLIKYNTEDTRNLSEIIEKIYEKLVKKTYGEINSP